ncbi:unnamed protein product [Fusarium venenatum]|uniref:Uncharacterized protein n=1 Tax=Fusarium venenatum TaxID=56646 RepID=A0A2L2THT4_9HYPO|nr:LOW QUALITY PROTEIN: uncharacterized protein FVRRES_09735 [Fusarium venenatum]CEI69658.1 unnamed protein product [Fusarium venenatum]
MAINKTVSFDFKDPVGQIPTSDFVDWENSLLERRLKATAHDNFEDKRTCKFNEEIIITTVRNYIVDTATESLIPMMLSWKPQWFQNFCS